MPHDEQQAAARFGFLGSLSAIAGIVLSGPATLPVVDAVGGQPPWQSARVFIDAYHPVQVLPYFFGLFFVAGCVVLVIGLRGLAGATAVSPCRLGVFASTAGATLIFFNYVVQTTFVPALVRTARPELHAVLESITMANPASLAWALEMWGYGLLGLGSWLASAALTGSGLERTARLLLAGNAVISLAGAVATAVRLEWVLTPAGLTSYVLWNVYFLATLVVVGVALRGRASAKGSG